jgi:two-component system NtrC family response regulator
MRCGGGALADIVGRCPAIESLRSEIRKLAPSEARVHVFGETGTGKERVALALHELSPRASKRFVPMNAAAITDDLLPTELFGSVRGAYTGAETRNGYIAEAEGGTLFIDEVAELSLLAQARLLRFLEEGEYRRVGETAVRRANVRVLSATNVDLPRRVAEGRFRADLWFRLKVHCLGVPPLRERGSDVLLLARHFLAAEAQLARVEAPRLSAEAEEALQAYAWSGNVRELEHEMQRLVVRAPGETIGRDALSPEIAAAPRPSGTLKAAMQRHESEILLSTLEKHEGRQARAAAELGITRQALWAKLRRLGVWPSEPV